MIKNMNPLYNKLKLLMNELCLYYTYTYERNISKVKLKFLPYHELENVGMHEYVNENVAGKIGFTVGICTYPSMLKR